MDPITILIGLALLSALWGAAATVTFINFRIKRGYLPKFIKNNKEQILLSFKKEKGV